jgi:molybdate transport system ATP-binding protein
MTAANCPAAETPGLRARIVVEREHFAVEVAVQVAVGETVAIMGPSGAGKSTLLQALAGLEPLSAGEIEVAGRVVDRVASPRVRTEPMSRGIVLLGQDARLFPHLSVRENVAFGPRAAGTDASAARDAADGWLARVGLRVERGSASLSPERSPHPPARCCSTNRWWRSTRRRRATSGRCCAIS